MCTRDHVHCQKSGTKVKHHVLKKLCEKAMKMEATCLNFVSAFHEEKCPPCKKDGSFLDSGGGNASMEMYVLSTRVVVDGRGVQKDTERNIGAERDG